MSFKQRLTQMLGFITFILTYALSYHPPREFLSLSDKKRQRDGGSKSTDLYEAQKLQLQLEYSLKQYLDYGYHSPELNETFKLYQDSYPIQRESVKIDGIIYS
jgi:hypothetical protein